MKSSFFDCTKELSSLVKLLTEFGKMVDQQENDGRGGGEVWTCVIGL